MSMHDLPDTTIQMYKMQSDGNVVLLNEVKFRQTIVDVLTIAATNTFNFTSDAAREMVANDIIKQIKRDDK